MAESEVQELLPRSLLRPRRILESETSLTVFDDDDDQTNK